LDKMAAEGRGEVEYVALNDDGSAAARRFHDRVRNPLLTDISIDWNKLPVADVYPQRIQDLFGAKPVVVTGRFTGSGRGMLLLKGKMSGRDFVREIPVDFESKSQREVLGSLWARARIDDLMASDYSGAQQGKMRQDLQETITQLGLEYRLMTQFTSFVAVEEMIVTEGGQPRRVDVPVEVPEGVNRSAIEPSSPAGGPTGLFTVHSGTNMFRVRGVGGSGSGRGSGGGGTSNRRYPAPPNAPPAVSIAIDADEAVVLTNPEERQAVKLRSKFHPALVAITERLKKKNPIAAVAEVKFVRDGKAEIQIWLTEKTDSNLAKLKELGFEVVLDPKTSKLVIGKLPIEKLEALATLDFVRFVAPQVNQ
jgi:hypothetical protein